ncbi:hypothetical protein PVK06_030527 [Gossypium arboreum]|uniref:DUF4283 domain-containing protein n=1 Tax=Gossypium arboreum TaxID=29729 RepID=A0ABR0NRQ7_GOSAR|nr:hypothetical protein PVK06_030527 [Gossypium arboreum]
MAADSVPFPKLSWKDMLLGEASYSASDRNGLNEGPDNDFDLLDGDVNTTMVDGMPTIAFSDRIRNILFKEMELTIALKLLGRNIGYNALHNRILSLWKPAKPFHLMDTVNGYFLIKFQNIGDYNKDFNLQQPYPSVVLAWILLPGLPGYLYNRKIIEAIGGLIGKVVKLDFQTDNGTRGYFARLAVFINLDKPLISEMEAQEGADGRSDGDKRPKFRPWMLVECKENLRGKGTVGVGNFKTRDTVGIKKGNGSNIGAGRGSELGQGIRLGPTKNLVSDSLKSMELGQNSNVGLDKYMGKRPIELAANEKSTEQVSSKSIGMGMEGGCQNSLNFDDSDNIISSNLESVKAHCNPAFEVSEGVEIEIFEGVLEPGKH